MSRSRKKTPSCHIVKRDGWYKTHYNRKLRRQGPLDIPDGRAYRKLNESWNIDDFHLVGLTREEHRRWCSHRLSGGDPEQDRQSDLLYDKYFIRK